MSDNLALKEKLEQLTFTAFRALGEVNGSFNFAVVCLFFMSLRICLKGGQNKKYKLNSNNIVV